MRKNRTEDSVKDYATRAFMEYFRHGSPTRSRIESEIRSRVQKELFGKDPQTVISACGREIERSKSFLEDIDAVNKTFAMLSDADMEYISTAVKAVYFVSKNRLLSCKDIKSRVLAHAMEVPADYRTVYRWLEKARSLFAVNRGLCLYSDMPLESSPEHDILYTG